MTLLDNHLILLRNMRIIIEATEDNRSTRWTTLNLVATCLHSAFYSALSFRSIVDSTYLSLVELRARQRTFDGAYTRTAVGTLGYTIVVLKLFDERFYRSRLSSPK